LLPVRLSAIAEKDTGAPKVPALDCGTPAMSRRGDHHEQSAYEHHLVCEAVEHKFAHLNLIL
jgi:hypothetical protein